jgi:hypothetical protein
MSETTAKKRKKISSKTLDISVVLFCLCGAAVSLYYFYQDIYSTFRSLNIMPAGTVTVKYNTVQRRLANRVVWDRLFEQSPVYSGDLVRIAQLSGATLNIDENSIELGENTLIRIQKDADSLQIDFSYGNIYVSSEEDGKIVSLSIANQIVQIAPGAGINALSGDDGLVLRVTKGAAQVIKDGQTRDVPAGGIIVQDADGGEVRRPMIAIINPKPNANFLKTDAMPLNVEFKWARFNMPPRDLIRLEIAEDRNFTKITHGIDNLDSSAVVSVNAGILYWRLLHGSNPLASGRINVTEASAPVLLAPAASGSSQIPVRFAGEEVQFRWAEIPYAAYYILQVARSQNFINPEIDLQVQVNYFVTSDIDIGTWYWRVLPVFPSVYEGEARFSQASSFQVQSVSVTTNTQPEEESRPEEAFISLLEQTRQIWQEQQAPPVPPAPLTQAEQLQQTVSVSQPQQESQTQQTQPPPLHLTLISPAQNAVIPGLTALRQPTVFRWDTDENIEFSRFVISSRANPVSGRPEISIQNPGRTVSVPKLPEGEWYWTVEGRSRDGRPITALSPRQIRVQPIPLLPAPRNRLPEAGFLIGAEEFRQSQNIVFSWSRVEGANFYILSILKEGFLRKQQIFKTDPLGALTYTFNNYSLFDDSGTFYWQVEAVFYNRDGELEQQGTPGENKFIIDIPRPGRVRTKNTGTLYGR